MDIAALLTAVLLALTGWFLWYRAGRRWMMLSTREKERRSRASFLFSRKGKRRKPRREAVRYLPR